jgi:ParB family chromosome partitioning protein
MREMDKDKTIRLPIDSIRLHEDTLQKQQANSHDTEKVKDLAENISKNGLQEPIRVILRQDGKYLLIEGYHRYMACKLLGWKEIECRVTKSVNPFFAS